MITCIDLENIRLSEISQRNTNTMWFHLYVKSKKQSKHNRNRFSDTESKKVESEGDK